ncbi:unnamed protein product [Rhizophagus irregularis]|nr:unnamed protein product [Rhizophagus irregularis]
MKNLLINHRNNLTEYKYYKDVEIVIVNKPYKRLRFRISTISTTISTTSTTSTSSTISTTISTSTLSTMSTISTISISTFDIINNVNNINNLSNLICYGQSDKPFFRLGRTKSINEIILKKCKEKELAGLILILTVLPRSQHQLEGQLALKRDELKDEQLSNKAAVQEFFF